VLELGAWGCFLDCHLLPCAVLGALSGMVLGIRSALAKGLDVVQLGNIEVRLDQLPGVAPDAIPVALFFGLPSDGEVARLAPPKAREVAEFVAWNARQVTLLPASHTTLLEAMFRCGGCAGRDSAAVCGAPRKRVHDRAASRAGRAGCEQRRRRPSAAPPPCACFGSSCPAPRWAMTTAPRCASSSALCRRGRARMGAPALCAPRTTLSCS